MKLLHLTLKAQWYNMIEQGVKTEEYREILHYLNRDAEDCNVYKSETLTCAESVPLIKVEEIKD